MNVILLIGCCYIFAMTVGAEKPTNQDTKLPKSTAVSNRGHWGGLDTHNHNHWHGHNGNGFDYYRNSRRAYAYPFVFPDQFDQFRSNQGFNQGFNQVPQWNRQQQPQRQFPATQNQQFTGKTQFPVTQNQGSTRFPVTQNQQFGGQRQIPVNQNQQFVAQSPFPVVQPQQFGSQQQFGRQQQQFGRPQVQFPQQQRPNNQPIRQLPQAQPNTDPSYFQCLNGCLSTNEYNPVCGSDGMTYPNSQRLNCSRRCGMNVSLQRMGACEPFLPELCANTPNCRLT